MKLNLNTGLSALPKIGAGTGPAPFVNTKSTDFDGVDDRLLFSSAIDLGTTSSESIWLKQDTPAAAENIIGIPVFTTSYHLHLDSSSNGAYVRNASYYWFFNSAATQAALNTTDWIHIAIIRTGLTTCRFYVNGVDNDGELTNGSMVGNTLVACLGDSYDGNYTYQGLIDEYACFDEVKAIGDLWDGTGKPTNLAAESGLVAWYRMGDSAVFNANSQWEFREQTKINNWSSHSFEFDGVNDYIATATGATIGIGNIFSMSCWVNANALVNYDCVCGNATALSLNDGYGFYHLNGKWRFFVHNWSGTYIESSISAVTGSWFHLVGVYDNSLGSANMEFYVNGVSQGTANETSALIVSGIFDIGRNQNNSYNLNGKVDGVSLWDEALTSGNVTSIFAAGVPNDVSDLGISGLQGYWRMGEGADWNNTNWQVPDYSKNALFSQQSFEFDGCDQTINCGDLTEVEGLTTVTLSVWLKGSVGNWVMAAYKNPVFGFYQSAGSGKINWRIKTAGGLVDILSNVITDGNWHHLVGTYDGATMRIYEDGVEVGSGIAQTGGILATATDLHFGSLDGSSLFWDGGLDEISIFDEVKSASDLYNSGKPGDLSAESGLIGWWKMGEGSTFSTNWTIPDASTNSNDGTSANMNEVDKKYISPGNEASGESSGMNEADNINNAPDNENQGLSVGMILGSVVEETP